ncbi:MAG TPA: hypothetical protein VEW65_00675, partial [Chryseolinea sp.]|nr:hypothetical protein [Chryseolinea sp.]
LFVSRQKEHNVYTELFGGLWQGRVHHQSLLAPQPRGCAFGNATEFCPCLREAASAKARRTCPGQTKDKIRLLIQKLEGRFVRPRVPSTLQKLN